MTSTGDVKCMAVILFCVSLDKTRTQTRKKNEIGILSLRMQTINSGLKVALAVQRRTCVTEDGGSLGRSRIRSTVVAKNKFDT